VGFSWDSNLCPPAQEAWIQASTSLYSSNCVWELSSRVIWLRERISAVPLGDQSQVMKCLVNFNWNKPHASWFVRPANPRGEMVTTKCWVSKLCVNFCTFVPLHNLSDLRSCEVRSINLVPFKYRYYLWSHACS
jgi:hypothetical protein